MRVAFGEGLLELGGEIEDLVVLTADVAKPTQVIGFGEHFPHRFLNVGIAEQDMVGIAAGLALSENIPVAVAFAPFMMRAWEQVRSTISRCNLNVKLVGTHAGLSASDEGASHQSLEDVALMRVLPNMTVVVPGDREEIKEATRAIVESKGPAYMRIGRDEDARFVEEGFRLGRATVLRDGSDVVIAAIPTEAVIKFAEECAGMMRPDATFVDVSSIKIGVVEEVLKRLPQRAGYASIHPLFTSPRVKDKDIAFMVLREAKTLKKFREALARSSRVFETTPEEHDRATATTQVLHHFALLTIKRTLLKHANESENFKTNSLRRTLAVIRMVERNYETVMTIQKLNRFGKEAREEFIREAEAFSAELSA